MEDVVTTGGFNFKKEDVRDVFEMYYTKGISILDITLYYPEMPVSAVQKIVFGVIYKEWTQDLKK